MTYECDQQMSIGVQISLKRKDIIPWRWKYHTPVGYGRAFHRSWGWEGGYPKSPYHMPRKILLKKIVHILNICLFCFLFLLLIFSYEKRIQYFCQAQFHRPFIFDVRQCASTIKLNMSRGILSPPQRLLWQSKIQTDERRHGKGDKASKT